MKVYVVVYGVGWPEDGDNVAGVYSTPELAAEAEAKDSRVWMVVEIELDAPPKF